ncbi:MAG: DUF5994 family protein [Actinophytocola sp.]|uniref:DUF5994 family protein n=1 Tax=Actinophytocola sp. TaxID=1872138 RepID=UPI003D6C3EFD
MTSGPHLPTNRPPAAGPARQALRLKLKPKAPATGYVDGAWWPRSLDLATELPALIEVLGVRLGHVEGVTYDLTAWDAVPRRLLVDGRLLRLGGYRSQNPHTIDVIGATGRRVTLLVLPPGTAEPIAHQVLMTTGRRDNVDSVDDLLAPAAAADPGPAGEDLPDIAVDRWEVDGGRIYAPQMTSRLSASRTGR